MSITQELIDSAKVAALAQARIGIERQRQNFLATFGSFFKPADLVKITDWWGLAVEAKAAQFMSATDDQAQEQADIYDSYLDAIEEVGTDYEVVGKAKAGMFARSVLHEVIGGGFAILGAVLQAGLAIVIPGFGSLIGAGLNAGIQHVVAHFNT